MDLYPEYTGTGYLFILGINDNEKDPANVYARTAADYLAKWNLVWLAPAPMNNTNAIAVTRGRRKVQPQDDVRLLRGGAQPALCRHSRLRAAPRWFGRHQGGVWRLHPKSLTVFDPGLKYKAITDGLADAVIAFSTDGQIAGFDLVVMQDDKGLWPPYQVAPVVRGEVLDKNPQIRGARPAGAADHQRRDCRPELEGRWRKAGVRPGRRRFPEGERVDQIDHLPLHRCTA
ncbi:MAG: hypothetical protein HZY76_01990 [Anaerolineae bacterium]|nr:MAG: hypothetical protein HZY76_01990 [Anaerolineae bacterium]